jgi:hypothetical protein
MTRPQAIDIISEILVLKCHGTFQDARKIADEILDRFGPALHLEPTVVECSATLKGVSKM